MLAKAVYSVARKRFDIDILTEWRRRRVRPTTNEIDYAEFINDIRTVLHALHLPVEQCYYKPLDVVCDALYLGEVMTTDLLVNVFLPQYWHATARTRLIDIYTSEEWLPPLNHDETYVI